MRCQVSVINFIANTHKIIQICVNVKVIEGGPHEINNQNRQFNSTNIYIYVYTICVLVYRCACAYMRRVAARR